jgi:hypothetical protein
MFKYDEEEPHHIIVVQEKTFVRVKILRGKE